MTAAFLHELNKTPGVLGSAYLGEETVFDFGDAIGGPDALPLAQRAATACEAWLASTETTDLETAVFVGAEGRIVAQAVDRGMLIAFAENEASAGLLKMRLRDTARRIRELHTPEASNV